MAAEAELADLDPVGLLRAAFDLQDQRNAARNQAAQLEAELAELMRLVKAARVESGYDCHSQCTAPSCVLRRFLERPRKAKNSGLADGPMLDYKAAREAALASVR